MWLMTLASTVAGSSLEAHEQVAWEQCHVSAGGCASRGGALRGITAGQQRHVDIEALGPEALTDLGFLMWFGV